MSNQNPEAVRRHIRTVLDAIGDVDCILDQSILADDCRHVADGLKSASREAIRIEPDSISELWELKMLHDRVKGIQVSLRVLRGSVDRAELALERAQDAIEAIGRIVETDEETNDTL